MTDENRKEQKDELTDQDLDQATGGVAHEAQVNRNPAVNRQKGLERQKGLTRL